MGEFINVKSLEPAGGELIPEADEKFDDTFGDIDDVCLSGDVERDYTTLVRKLQDAVNDHLGEALEKVCHDPKPYAFLSRSFDKDELANVRISSSPTAIPVKCLLPFHKEISLDDSLLFSLRSDSMNGESNMFCDPVTVVAPIVTYNKTFIIDGHHRWLELYLINPDAKISAININYEQSYIWKPRSIFQDAIMAAGNDFLQSSKENMLLEMSKEQIREYITQNITDACVRSLISANAKAWEITVTDKESAIEYIEQNARALKSENMP